MSEDIELNGMRRGDCEPHHHGHRHGCGRPMVVLERDMPEDLAAAVKQVQSAAKAVEEMARIKTKGSDGKSAYDLYVEKGGELTLEQWLESLHGPQGIQGPAGPQGSLGEFYVGHVDSTSTATDFTATIPGITSLHNGVAVYLTNGVINSATGCTLDINGLGAKPMRRSNTASSLVTTHFQASYTILLVYNEDAIAGGCWDFYVGYDTNDNSVGYILRFAASVYPVTDTCGRHRLLFTSADGLGLVPANTSTVTNLTTKRDVNQRPIDPFGKIFFSQTTAVMSQGDLPLISYLHYQYLIYLGYSFNRTGVALNMPYPRDVYIKCAPQADGSAIIDADEPYVLSLPSTADGKIYIYLGFSTYPTQIQLTPWHPVYYHDGVAVRRWLGKRTAAAYVAEYGVSAYAEVLAHIGIDVVSVDCVVSGKSYRLSYAMTDTTNDEIWFSGTDPVTGNHIWAKVDSTDTWLAWYV